MSVGDVGRLRAFALVLDLGSISAAASVLGYTQSAVSQQLAALEREVGAALVDRSRRPLRATRAGEQLRPHVERVLAAIGGADAALEDVRGSMRRLRLAAFTSALSSFVPAAVRDLRRAHPDLVVQVLQLETREAVEHLRDGRADLAVVDHMCAEAGFAPRVTYELDDLPAAQAFVAAGIALVPMHGLTLATLPAGVTALPLAESPAGSRTVQA